MKAITLWQPWASLVAIGAKRIETRSWATKYRGPLAIHAAQKHITIVDDLKASRLIQNTIHSRGVAIKDLPKGVVLATSILVDCVRITPEFMDTLSEQEKAFGDYTLGRYAWVLEDIKKLDKPIPAIGKQRLWEWESPEGVSW